MNQRHALLAAALATACVASLGTAHAADTDKEKCFGIAAAGKNDCATGNHSCAGMAKGNKEAGEWKYVTKGTCAKEGGTTKAPK